MIVVGLVEGVLVGIKGRSLGWIIIVKVNHDSAMMRNHGVGLS